MKSQTWKATAVLISTASVCLGARDRLTVEVRDHAGLPKDVLSGALDTVGATMHRVGIDTVWSVCPSTHGIVDCPEPLAPSSGLCVRVIIAARSAHPLAGAPIDQGGFAFSGEVALGQPRAWVFYPMVQWMAHATSRSTALVLAGVLIHEIGHVLGLKHHSTGIMQPALKPRDLDELSRCRAFSPAEAKQLSEGVTRLNAASPND